jgi:hypothetical protein
MTPDVNSKKLTRMCTGIRRHTPVTEGRLGSVKPHIHGQRYKLQTLAMEATTLFFLSKRKIIQVWIEFFMRALFALHNVSRLILLNDHARIWKLPI